MLDDLQELLMKDPWRPFIYVLVAMAASALVQYVCYVLGKKITVFNSLAELLRWITRPLVFVAVLLFVHAGMMHVAVPPRFWYASGLFALFITVFGFGYIMSAKR